MQIEPLSNRYRDTQMASFASSLFSEPIKKGADSSHPIKLFQYGTRIKYAISYMLAFMPAPFSHGNTRIPVSENQRFIVTKIDT